MNDKPASLKGDEIGSSDNDPADVEPSSNDLQSPSLSKPEDFHIL